ncbi:MAG: hypothetical protein IT184_08495 [Acidobacteria bacterium]|nr:hypothetical protein [Acidobacteriota bacterium]
MSDRHWAWGIRSLALIAFVLAIVAIVEARAIRQARGELQALRDERARGIASLHAVWAGAAVDETVAALQALDTMFEEPTEGLGRAGGLCAGGRVDGRAVADFVRAFAAARSTGTSKAGAIDTMREAVRATAEFRSKHPDLVPKP